MSKRICTIGLTLPGEEFYDIAYESDATLVEWDIILFQPTLGNVKAADRLNGLPVLRHDDSFNAQKLANHWKSEIMAAYRAGRIVIVFLSKPVDCFVYTGEKQFSGTGRNRQTTELANPFSSYSSVPLTKPKAVTGTEMQLDRGAKYFAPYWHEVSEHSQYEVQIEGKFNQVLLRSRVGDRILGGAFHSKNGGAILCVPPITLDDTNGMTTEDPDGGEFLIWSEKAFQFGKRLSATLCSMADVITKARQVTPTPVWANDSQFSLEDESKLRASISVCATEIEQLQAKQAILEGNLIEAGILRGLLFETGKPLEAAILESLRLFGFTAEPFADGESEFDSVFVSSEGRCLGEAEGKDNRPISIDKFQQLERNINEDFGRDEVTEIAKAVLFGNAFRLLPLNEREDFFTTKCYSAAKRVGAALVRTPDMFLSAKYLKENGDEEYAAECRKSIFSAAGTLVTFPPIPTAVSPGVHIKAGGDVLTAPQQ